MSNVVNPTAKPKRKRKRSDEWGNCPVCGYEADEWLNVGRTHWLVCNEHKTKWTIGSNLFSSWHDETEQDWLRNQTRLAEYRGVVPVFPNQMWVRFKRKSYWLWRKFQKAVKGSTEEPFPF